MLKLVWIDTETSDLDADRCDLLELAIVVPHKGVRWSRKFTMEHPEWAHPRALEVNGYTPEKWAVAGARPFAESADEVLGMLEGADAIAGHNPKFDIDILAGAFRRLDRAKDWRRRVTYHGFDTVTLAQEHLGHLGLPNLRLDTVCPFLGISNEGNHTALTDVDRAIAVHAKLSRASSLDRAWWFIRNRPALWWGRGEVGRIAIEMAAYKAKKAARKDT